MSGFLVRAPEIVGMNQLVDGSAKPAFRHWMDNWSDIQDHLFILYTMSKGIVVELGTRGGVSTSAFLAALEGGDGKLVSVEIDEKCRVSFDTHPQWTFLVGSSIDKAMPQIVLSVMGSFNANNDGEFIDLLFIDTDHTYEQLKKELELWSPFVKKGGFILIHDVLSFPEMGKAAAEFSGKNKLNYHVHQGSNGLGIISI